MSSCFDLANKAFVGGEQRANPSRDVLMSCMIGVVLTPNDVTVTGKKWSRIMLKYMSFI